MSEPRIVDLVFRAGPPPSRRLPALVIAALAHVGLAAWVVGMQPSLEAWSADLASRIHDELVRVEIVDIATPPEPKPPEPEPAPAAPPPPSNEPAPASPSPPAAPRARLKVGAAPAQAGKILSAPKGALDLTGEVFIEGQGSAYAGGASSPGGAGKGPVARVGTPPAAPPAPPAKPPAGRSRAAPVSLRSGQWSCPWPEQAIDLPLDEQTAIIRVTVRADGVVETSEIVDDPGDGFAAAALRCARATRFTPATDFDGKPIRATSPPIRVHFYR